MKNCLIVLQTVYKQVNTLPPPPPPATPVVPSVEGADIGQCDQQTLRGFIINK